MKRRRRVYPAGGRPVIGGQDRGAHREVAVSPLRTVHQGALPVTRGSEHHATLQVSRYGQFGFLSGCGQLGVAPDAPSVRLPPQLCSLFPGRPISTVCSPGIARMYGRAGRRKGRPKVIVMAKARGHHQHEALKHRHEHYPVNALPSSGRELGAPQIPGRSSAREATAWWAA